KVCPMAASSDPNPPVPLPTTHPNGSPLPAAFGRYQVRAYVGGGGMGAIYLAHDPQLNREVAIKVPILTDHPSAMADARRRFLREAKAAASVQHPAVCSVFDSGEQDGQPYVVMTYIAGESLSARLQRERQF